MDSRLQTEKLRGIRGWLVFYIAVTGIGILANTPAIRDYSAGQLAASGAILLAIATLQACGVVLIFCCRRSVTRTFHISLYGVLLILVALGSAVSWQAQDINAILGTGIWLVYWMCSERVRVNFPRVRALRRATTQDSVGGPRSRKNPLSI